jgi:hypothetical protein
MKFGTTMVFVASFALNLSAVSDGFIKLHSGQATDQVKDTIYQALDQVA